jgi:hypothetical protein
MSQPFNWWIRQQSSSGASISFTPNLSSSYGSGDIFSLIVTPPRPTNAIGFRVYVKYGTFGVSGSPAITSPVLLLSFAPYPSPDPSSNAPIYFEFGTQVYINVTAYNLGFETAIVEGAWVSFYSEPPGD